MHSWPQILSIWSWLVQFISILNNPELYCENNNVTKILIDFIVNSYRDLDKADNSLFEKLKKSFSKYNIFV